jgi:hemerythrin-like domain-containing protein
MNRTTAQTGADLIDLLLGEHGCILALIRHQERRMARMSLCGLQECAAALEAVLQAHAVEEDQLLFGRLEEAPAAVRATLEAMYGEHQEMRALLEELRKQRQAARARAMLGRLMELAREHFAVEERVLFGLVREWMSPETLQKLGREYARRRGMQLPD